MSVLASLSIHDAFVSLLPRLQTHARVRFRRLNPTDREEAVADVVAYGFLSFLRLKERGKDPTTFPAVFAHFVAQAVSNGRGIVHRLSIQDVMAARMQRAHVTVHRLDDLMPGGGWWRDLALDWRVRVAEQAAFNIDFPAWLGTLPAPKRRVAELLAQGHGTEETASQTQLSAGRVSQLRREFADSWVAFHAGS
jgi:hypothetical protein